MGFSELTHAYVAAQFYTRLKDIFGMQGEAAFTHATQMHAHQRGQRMAQRAIANKQPLDFQTYIQFGEWMASEETKVQNCSNQSYVVKDTPDFQRNITRCPWHTYFTQTNQLQAGQVYCHDLDSSICRGFNPYLNFQVHDTLYEGNCCENIMVNANLDCNNLPKRNVAFTLPFSYHTAHSYWVYTRVSRSIFGEAGIQIASQVLSDFESTHGKEMTQQLCAYQHTDFTVLPDTEISN